VYEFNPQARGEEARHAASLSLPAPPLGSFQSTFSFVPAPLGSTAFFQRYASCPASPRLFQLSPTCHSICLKIELDNNHMDTGSGTLFIPSVAIASAISLVNLRTLPKEVSWEDWACGSTWFNDLYLRNMNDYVNGPHAAFVRQDYRSRSWEIQIHDVSSGRLAGPPVSGSTCSDSMPDTADSCLEAMFVEDGRRVRHSKMISSFLIPHTVVSGRADLTGGRPHVMLDEEH
ncbi:hypothetical protein FRC07_011799, partial [Ceratobasidium sp. 392]